MSARSGVELRLTAMAAALAAAGAAWADERDDEIAKLTRPDSTVELGRGLRRRRQHALRPVQRHGQGPSLPAVRRDASQRRDDATGTWTNITGRNLGLESRELRFDQSRQGDWGYFIDFSQTPRYSPYTPITGLTGYDSTSQTVNGQGQNPLELKTERKALSGRRRQVGQFERGTCASPRSRRKRPAAACSAAAAAPTSSSTRSTIARSSTRRRSATPASRRSSPAATTAPTSSTTRTGST